MAPETPKKISYVEDQSEPRTYILSPYRAFLMGQMALSGMYKELINSELGSGVIDEQATQNP